MIVVRLKGGLGNQMFQYAAGLALARRRGDRLALDLTWLLDRTPRRNFIFRNFDLPALRVEAEVTRLSRAAQLAPLPMAYAGLSILLRSCGRSLAGWQILKEQRNDDPTSCLGSARDVLLDGYWQEERYFAGVEPELKEVFRPRLALNSKAEDLAAELSEQDTVCVNVRRGDYVSLARSANTYGFVSVDYYQRAVNALSETARPLRFYVFSDEIEWCRQNLVFPGHTIRYLGHEFKGERFAQYLHLMSRCRHFIIPNSSFAWWAAWLGQRPDATVIVPDRWFADGREAPSGLLPSQWRRI